MPAGPTWNTGNRRLGIIFVVIVSAIATGVIILMVRDGSRSVYIGRQWELVWVAHGGRALSLPEGKRATIAYLSDSEFTMHDTVNYIDGQIEPSGSGYTITGATTTAKAYRGTDPRVPALEAAMTPLGTAGTVRAEVIAGQLVLQAGTYVLTFHDAGPVQRT